MHLSAHPGRDFPGTRDLDPFTGEVQNELVPGWYWRYPAQCEALATWFEEQAGAAIDPTRRVVSGPASLPGPGARCLCERGPRHRAGHLCARPSQRGANVAFSWSEQGAHAFALASRLLAAGKHGGWKRWLVAARFESAHRVGRPQQAGRLTEADLRGLEREAYAAEWGRRIRGLVEAAAPR